MQSRRVFLSNLLATLAMLSSCRYASAAAEPIVVFKGESVFHRICAKAKAEKWATLPIGELMGKIALELEGTEYVANTLELSVDRELCSVNLTALDCVTFFETTLGFARMLKNGGSTPSDLLAEVTHTRYRSGIVGDYTSRLHYTTDWFYDNEKKGVIKMLSQLPGAQPFKQKVGIMTSNAASCPQLAAHPELVEKIKAQEAAINKRSMKFIPMDKVAAVEPLLKTGDIVGLCTGEPGLDVAHTGLVLRSADGVAHFMDASSRKATMKVVIEPGPISTSVSRNKKLTGVMFARPLEPKYSGK